MAEGYVGILADVICQHSKDGNIVPMRVRFETEGEVFTYNIVSYKDKTEHGLAYNKRYIWIFECAIQIRENQMGKILLRFFPHDLVWSVEPIA